jgi:hypothetical protein
LIGADLRDPSSFFENEMESNLEQELLDMIGADWRINLIGPIGVCAAYSAQNQYEKRGARRLARNDNPRPSR